MQSQTNREPILFTRGVPAVEALPNTLLEECFRAVLQGPTGKTVLQYGHNSGYLPLKKLLSEQYNVAPEQIIIGNGSLHLQDMLAGMLVQPGDVVFVEQPSYDRAIKTFRRRGAKVFGIPLVPDFQNPAGVTTSAEKRQALVDLAQRYDFWLIEDVPYRTLRYSGDSLPLLRDLSDAHVLTISSYSKLISPGLRVGYLIGPTSLTKTLAQLEEDTILAPVLPAQAAVVEFHQRGYFSSNLESLKKLYAPRLNTIVSALRTQLPAVSFAEPQGGFFVSITLPEQYHVTDLLAQAKAHGLSLTDGRDFFADSLDGTPTAGERFIRLPFCALTPAQIEEGVQRLANVIA